MHYLLDTNAVSEVRKKARANRGMLGWYLSHDAALSGLSVVTLGEIRYGIENKRSVDLSQALALESWLRGLEFEFQNQILSITAAIADRWGRLRSEGGLPENDAWIAATAMEHDLTIVTRNVSDFEGTGVRVLNPFT